MMKRVPAIYIICCVLLAAACAKKRSWDNPLDPANSTVTAPGGPVPANNAVYIDTALTLSWTGGDPNTGDAVQFTLYFGTTTPPTNKLYTGYDLGYPMNGLSLNTQYYWKVTAVDNHGVKADGPVWCFFTKYNLPPTSPANPAPAIGATCDTSVQLQWSCTDPDPEDIVQYDVFLDTINPPMRVAAAAQTDRYFNASSLQFAKTYYWRVIASDNHNATTSGPIWNINTKVVHEVGHWSYPDIGSVAVSGTYAFLSSGYGMRIIDISNPAAPIESGHYSSPANTVDVAVVGNYAYVADNPYGLWIVDISNPASPTGIGACQTLGDVKSVTVSGNHAYMAYGGAGLRIFDISNPAAPSETGCFDTPGAAYDVAVVGNYAYVADLTSGLRIIDVSDPASPVEVGSYDTPGHALKVVVSGSNAYVADDWCGLRVINISNPAAPVETGYDDPWNGHYRSVAVSGNCAYVADDYSMWVINIGNPANPVPMEFCYLPDYAYDVVVSGKYAYVADANALRIIQIAP